MTNIGSDQFSVGRLVDWGLATLLTQIRLVLRQIVLQVTHYYSIHAASYYMLHPLNSLEIVAAFITEIQQS